MAASMSLCTSNHLPWKSQTTRNTGLKPIRPSSLSRIYQRNQHHYFQSSGRLSRTFVVFAATEGSTKSSKSDEQIPSWARPDTDEPPPWARDEGNGSASLSTFEIPFYAYLLASAFTAIAAIVCYMLHCSGSSFLLGYQPLPFCGLNLSKWPTKRLKNKTGEMVIAR